MREIKFRAWDEEEKIMLYDINDIYCSDKDFTKFGIQTEEHGEFYDVTLLQYTGLKDKNGKEIYEGDILAHPDEQKWHYRVVWDEGEFGALNPIEGYESLGSLYEFVEIIGNFYENPELLDKQKYE